jgi:hypothetical protein
MGRAKDEWMESEARGYSEIEDRLICENCLLDDDLKRLVTTTIGDCSYCKGGKVRIVDATVVQRRIMESVGEEYRSVDEESPMYCSAEGGYQTKTISSNEVLMNEVQEWVVNEFYDELVEHHVYEEWCTREHQILHPYDHIRAGWSSFTDTVMHERRFTFLIEPESDPGHPDSISPGQTLVQVGAIVDNLKLYSILNPSSSLYRIRVHGAKERLLNAKALGVPPGTKAAANRMSPAGIPMFYAAEDAVTAELETWDGRRSVWATTGEFTIVHPLLVVDFTNLPAIPGFFSGCTRNARAAIRFLHHFVNDMEKPIERDGREHTDYVPTQVIAEYLLKSHQVTLASVPHGAPMKISGIRFRSSKSGATINVALALDASEVEDAPGSAKGMVVLKSTSRRKLSIGTTSRPAKRSNPSKLNRLKP